MKKWINYYQYQDNQEVVEDPVEDPAEDPVEDPKKIIVEDPKKIIAEDPENKNSTHQNKLLKKFNKKSQ